MPSRVGYWWRDTALTRNQAEFLAAYQRDTTRLTVIARQVNIAISDVYTWIACNTNGFNDKLREINRAHVMAIIGDEIACARGEKELGNPQKSRQFLLKQFKEEGQKGQKMTVEREDVERYDKFELQKDGYAG